MGNFMANLIQGHEVVGYDIVENAKFKTYSVEEEFLNNDFDVVVDFSNSELSEQILMKLLKSNVKIITGTSNISNIEEISNYAFINKISFVYLENFSKGINQLINIIDKIDCNSKEIIEQHYKTKKDISQTALSLAASLNLNSTNISSIRSELKQSNHYIKYYLDGEEITIIHKCLNYDAYKEIFLQELNNVLTNDFYFKKSILGE